jgi:hypothetical protein
MEVNPGAPSTGYRDTWRFVTELHQTGVEERMPYQWYYVERERLIAGYERRTARLIGWLGPDGFTSPTALATSFQKPLRLMGYENSWGLADASGFYRIDLDKRTVQKLFTASPGETVVAGAVGSASGAGPRGRGQYFEAFATTKNLFVQSVLLRVGFPQLADGALSFKTPLAPLPSPYRELKIRRALRAEGAPFFLWYEPDYDPWGRLPTQAFKLDQQGEVVARYTLPSLLETPNIPWSHTVILASGMPLMVRGAIEAEFRRSGAHVLIAWSSREQEVFSWILPIVAALLSAVFIYLRARSYAFGARRLWVWTVLGLALGPLGILLMMALIEWPARETCPSCGRKRVVTNERCEHCRAPFAPVTADGSEIFDPALAP